MPNRCVASHGPLTQLFNIHFPRLSSLHLGEWKSATLINSALTNFLIAHPLIEDLELCFSDENEGVGEEEVHCHVSPVALRPGTLPNLRSLTADAFNLRAFLSSEVLSLQTLESLHTGVGYFKEQEDGYAQFSEMFCMLEAKGGLPGLKVLELELDGLYGGEVDNAYWIAGFGKLCPKVEKFWGDFEVEWTDVSYFYWCLEVLMYRPDYVPE